MVVHLQKFQVGPHGDFELTASCHSFFFFKSNHTISRADLDKNCAFCDKSMKLGTRFLDILRSILRNGATSDLTFGDL